MRASSWEDLGKKEGRVRGSRAGGGEGLKWNEGKLTMCATRRSLKASLVPDGCSGEGEIFGYRLAGESQPIVVAIGPCEKVLAPRRKSFRRGQRVPWANTP